MVALVLLISFASASTFASSGGDIVRLICRLLPFITRDDFGDRGLVYAFLLFFFTSFFCVSHVVLSLNE
jgi:hypothetical protein